MTAELIDQWVRTYMRAGISEGVSLQRAAKPDARPSWDEYFLSIARVVATRADCRRAQVGAVLVNSNHEIRGTGYNGAPAGVPGCASAGACPRGQLSYEELPADSSYDSCTADHAERNAIRHTNHLEWSGATLYVTRRPCPACQTLINAAGIARVVTPEGEME